MTDYTDPESPVADAHAVDRKRFNGTQSMVGMDGKPRCINCGLYEREHINGYFCPEWRLRQLDGDR